MRTLLTAILLPAVCLTLAADPTGRISGKVLGKDGKPIPTAVLTVQRTDISWSKEIKVNDKGNYFQVGIEAKDYHLSIDAPGYQSYKEDIHVPLGETLTKNYTLFTMKEAQEEALKNGAAQLAPGEAQSLTGSAAFNEGIEFYNQQNFAEALPHLDKAMKDLHEAAAAMADGDNKTALVGRLPMVERVYGVAAFEVGHADPAKKDLMLKAEPYLAAASEKNPKDQRLLSDLIVIAKAKGDADAAKKYQASLDALIGPRPEMAYNDGVTAFNDGKYKEAKVFVTKAIETDPKFADSYWLLGVVEFGLGNPNGAKTAFKKYLEIAPNGKKAGEVKEFLKELK